jgi:adenylylsulfate kinase
MIIILCGSAGAGKSSIAMRLAGELEDARVVSTDLFKRRVYERLFREVRNRFGRQKYLILDGTFYRKEYRDRIEEIASNEEKVVTIFVECKLETCLKRNGERAEPIPERAVKSIWNQFERPERPDIYINSDEVDVDGVVEIILERLKSLEEAERSNIKV